jgi:hypothetical protein
MNDLIELLGAKPQANMAAVKFFMEPFLQNDVRDSGGVPPRIAGLLHRPELLVMLKVWFNVLDADERKLALARVMERAVNDLAHPSF